jgi:hypothetical protein
MGRYCQLIGRVDGLAAPSDHVFGRSFDYETYYNSGDLLTPWIDYLLVYRHNKAFAAVGGKFSREWRLTFPIHFHVRCSYGSVSSGTPGMCQRDLLCMLGQYAFRFLSCYGVKELQWVC